jgi:hypothetical protein
MARKKDIVPKKTFATKEDFRKFVEKEKEWMYERIIQCIKYAYKYHLIEAKVLEASIEDSMTIIEMNSYAEDWEESLTLAITWYELSENYEKCSEILKLLHSIQDSQNKDLSTI